MQPPLCLVAADIHGNKEQYEKIMRVVREQNISLVLLAGDLLPKDGGSWSPDNKIRTISMQKEFITSYFLSYLEELGSLTTVCAIFGNDDFKSNYPLVKNTPLPSVHFLDSETIQLSIAGQKVYVAGYPYVGFTPFLQKDWERRDATSDIAEHKVFRSDGYTSKNGAHFPVDLLDSATSPETIQDDLNKLALQSPPRETIYLFHEAPYGTPLDMIAPDNKYIQDNELHIGSKAMRQFIETAQPLATVHGHIHETLEQSGSFLWNYGTGASLTPANDFKSSTLAYVTFSLSSPQKATRLTL